MSKKTYHRSLRATIGMSSIAIASLALTSCSPPTTEPTSSAGAPSTAVTPSADPDTDWVEQDKPRIPDSVEVKTQAFKMWAPGRPPYDDQLQHAYRQTDPVANNYISELVLADDGMIDIAFVFEGQDLIRRVVGAYVTDDKDSTKAKVPMTCSLADPSGPQQFVCTAQFSVPGNLGGTFYGVLETEPSSPPDSSYGELRTVGSVTVSPFGSNGDLCAEVDGETHCNSLPATG